MDGCSCLKVELLFKFNFVGLGLQINYYKVQFMQYIPVQYSCRF